MREIKFRAWHKGQKQMFTALYLTFGGKIGIWNYEETEIDFASDYPYLELMQYTGLKDKNGKEIYEGDICRAMQGEQQKPESFYLTKSNVTFWRGSFEFFGKPLSDVNTDNNGYAKSIMWCWHGHNNLPDIYEEINNIEIIGNRFENPELLKQ